MTMMQDLEGQNWDETETGGQPLDPVPAGEYIVEGSKTEYGKNKSSTGTILEIENTILDGPYKGRKLYDSINISHQSKDAERIGRSQLKGLAVSMGMPAPSLDPRDYLNKPYVAVVKITPATERYSARNEIKGYRDKSQYDPAKQGQAPAQQERTTGGWQAPDERQDQGGSQQQSGGQTDDRPSWERD